MPDAPVPQIETQGYRIGSQDYYNRAESCYWAVPRTRDVAWLFYSALETRYCIERVLFQYLVVFGHPQWNPRWERDSLYSAAQFKRVILEVEPEFDQKIRFANAVSSGGEGVGVFPLDLDNIGEKYGRLGRFLHAPNLLESVIVNGDWWNELQLLLRDTLDLLRAIHGQLMAGVIIHDDTTDIYGRWKSGELTDEEARAEFWGDIEADDSA